MPLNDISDAWIDAFLDTRDDAQTVIEAGFAASLLSAGSRVLDLACGYGRHASVLTALGLQVVGLDRDARMLARAGRTCPVVQAEMRQLPFAVESFDAVTSFWQSFGYFSDDENLAMLRDLWGIVRPGGVLLLDLYNREFFETIPAGREFTRGGILVREATSLINDRLRVRLTYNNGAECDDFEWQVFTPRTLCDAAVATGWVVSGIHSDFDRSKTPGHGAPRVQYVLSRPGTKSVT